MQSIISRSIVGLRCSVASIVSASRRWYPQRRDAAQKPAASSQPAKLLDRISRFAYEPWNMQHGIGSISDKNWISEGMERGEVRKESNDVHDSKIMERAEVRKENNDVHDSKFMAADRIWHARILEKSSHRDGAIYKENWGECFLMDLADRNETVSELKMLTKALPCYPDQENCIAHMPCGMIQIFSVRLGKTLRSGPIRLYGYMAARDDMDGLLNYVFNCNRDNPVIMQQDSIIEMTGPKRGIIMLSDVLIEFDMKIETGEKEEDDILIDGLMQLDPRMSTRPFTIRFNSNCGTVDMCLALVEDAVEAIIEVFISEVQSVFNLSLSSFVTIREVGKEFQLFNGVVGELGIKRFVVAVPIDTMMHLKFKIGEKGSDSHVLHNCSFNAKLHGSPSQQIKLEAACISVKVTWSPPLY
ncbi:unnamed protein product [Urochloa decumbens]|uniref:DUF6598 domain-containing protein n=1 Tax=Urochloa decumbens TaxID=240449 RepID=A0ABC8X9C9_9POAL